MAVYRMVGRLRWRAAAYALQEPENTERRMGIRDLHTASCATALDGGAIRDLEVLDDDTTDSRDARGGIFRLVASTRIGYDATQGDQAMLAEDGDIAHAFRGER